MDEKEYKKYHYIGKKLPESFPVKTEQELYVQSGVYPPVWGMKIGETSAVEGFRSYLIADRDCQGKTMLEKAIECGAALSVTRHATFLVDEASNKRVSGLITYYYLPFEQDDATYMLPTSGEPIENAVNVETTGEVEIHLVVGEDDWERYVTLPVKTAWPSLNLLDIIDELEDTFRDWSENKENGFKYSEDDLEGSYNPVEVIFFNKLGEARTFWFDNIRDLLRHIVCIRLVNIDNKIIETKKHKKK